MTYSEKEAAYRTLLGAPSSRLSDLAELLEGWAASKPPDYAMRKDLNHCAAALREAEALLREVSTEKVPTLELYKRIRTLTDSGGE